MFNNIRLDRSKGIIPALVEAVEKLCVATRENYIQGDNKNIFVDHTPNGTIIKGKSQIFGGIGGGGGESTQIYPVSLEWRPVVHMMYAPNMDWTLTASQTASSSSTDPSTGITTENWRFRVDAKGGQYYYNGLAVNGSDATNRATINFTRYTSPTQEYTYNVVISWSRNSQTITFTETDEFSLYFYWQITSNGSAQFLVTRDRVIDNTLRWPVGVLTADKVDKMIKIYNCCNIPTFMVTTIWSA